MKLKDGSKLWSAPHQPQSVRDALEKAAKIAEDVTKYMQFQTKEDYKIANEIASQIRALIEYDAPSAPIEAEKSGKDEALNMAIEAINMHRARYDNLVNAITNAIESGNKALIPSTQTKESEG